jgi:hypothetical protein
VDAAGGELEAQGILIRHRGGDEKIADCGVPLALHDVSLRGMARA